MGESRVSCTIDLTSEGKQFGVIESTKAVSELYSPVAGEVVEVNARLDGEPALVNSDPYGDGWMIKMRLANAADRDGLMDAGAYKQHVGE